MNLRPSGYEPDSSPRVSAVFSPMSLLSRCGPSLRKQSRCGVAVHCEKRSLLLSIIIKLTQKLLLCELNVCLSETQLSSGSCFTI